MIKTLTLLIAAASLATASAQTLGDVLRQNETNRPAMKHPLIGKKFMLTTNGAPEAAELEVTNVTKEGHVSGVLRTSTGTNVITSSMTVSNQDLWNGRRWHRKAK